MQSQTSLDRRPLSFIILGIITLYSLGLTFFWGQWSPDLSALYMAALSIQNDMPYAIFNSNEYINGISSFEVWEDLLDQIGHKGQTTFPYLYPPIWAYLLAPLTQWVSPIAFFKIFLVLHITMLALTPLLVLKICKIEKNLLLSWIFVAYLLMISSRPSVNGLAQNQLQITITFLTVLTFYLFKSGASYRAGMILGIAAAIKISPAIFAIIFVINKDWRAIFAMAITGGILLAISLAFGGVELHREWLGLLENIDQRTIFIKVNLSAELLFAHLHNVIFPAHPTTSLHPAAWVQITPKILLLLSIASIVLRRNMSLSAQLLILAIASALLGPLSWIHYYILPLLLLPALFNHYSNRTSFFMIGLCLIVTSLPFKMLGTTLNYPEFVVENLIPTVYFFLLLAVMIFAPSKTDTQTRIG